MAVVPTAPASTPPRSTPLSGRLIVVVLPSSLMLHTALKRRRRTTRSPDGSSVISWVAPGGNLPSGPAYCASPRAIAAAVNSRSASMMSDDRDFRFLGLSSAAHPAALAELVLADAFVRAADDLRLGAGWADESFAALDPPLCCRLVMRLRPLDRKKVYLCRPTVSQGH